MATNNLAVFDLVLLRRHLVVLFAEGRLNDDSASFGYDWLPLSAR